MSIRKIPQCIRPLTLVVLGVLGVHASSMSAAPPNYLILTAPVAPLPPQPTYSGYPGRSQNVSTQTYSYGWFGVQPRQHWSRHFGYYRSYTQWSAK